MLTIQGEEHRSLKIIDIHEILFFFGGGGIMV
jgi:hypothetical protein